MVQALVVIVLMLSAWPRTSPTPAPVPVVVELFTSEGCSSCPPADALLSRLSREQSVAGVTIIPLGLHVTYWDRLGWKDPSSLREATQRQQRYGALWGTDNIYTPQAVVDGQQQLVGSDEPGLRRAISRAAERPHAAVTVTAGFEGEQIVTTVAVADLPPGLKEPIDAALFITQDRVTTVVTAGENKGRTLHHEAIVLLARDNWEPDLARPSATRLVSLSIRDARRFLRLDHLNAVVVLYGRKTGRIVGAATAPLALAAPAR
jgi:hypothetical protein